MYVTSSLGLFVTAEFSRLPYLVFVEKLSVSTASASRQPKLDVPFTQSCTSGAMANVTQI